MFIYGADAPPACAGVGVAPLLLFGVISIEDFVEPGMAIGRGLFTPFGLNSESARLRRFWRLGGGSTAPRGCEIVTLEDGTEGGGEISAGGLADAPVGVCGEIPDSLRLEFNLKVGNLESSLALRVRHALRWRSAVALLRMSGSALRLFTRTFTFFPGYVRMKFSYMWTVCRCCRRLSKCEKRFKHRSHLNGRSPVCFLMCLAKCSDRVKVMEQLGKPVHRYMRFLRFLRFLPRAAVAAAGGGLGDDEEDCGCAVASAASSLLLRCCACTPALVAAAAPVSAPASARALNEGFCAAGAAASLVEVEVEFAADVISRMLESKADRIRKELFRMPVETQAQGQKECTAAKEDGQNSERKREILHKLNERLSQIPNSIWISEVS